MLLGVGFGGFVDGIVLHQILQWHHMLTSTGDHPADTVPGLEANTAADGLFHAATWVFLVAGVVLLRRAWADGEAGPSLRVLVGMMLAGWGLFNVVEGVVDHHLLGVHDVRDDVADPLWWNVGFLAFGAALMIVGAVAGPHERALAPAHAAAPSLGAALSVGRICVPPTAPGVRRPLSRSGPRPASGPRPGPRVSSMAARAASCWSTMPSRSAVEAASSSRGSVSVMSCGYPSGRA